MLRLVLCSAFVKWWQTIVGVPAYLTLNILTQMISSSAVPYILWHSYTIVGRDSIFDCTVMYACCMHHYTYILSFVWKSRTRESNLKWFCQEIIIFDYFHDESPCVLALLAIILTQSPAQGVEPAARHNELCKLHRLYLLSSPSPYMSVWPSLSTQYGQEIQGWCYRLFGVYESVFLTSAVDCE